jgi:hypothetical protein
LRAIAQPTAAGKTARPSSVKRQGKGVPKKYWSSSSASSGRKLTVAPSSITVARSRTGSPRRARYSRARDAMQTIPSATEKKKPAVTGTGSARPSGGASSVRVIRSSAAE